MTSTDFGTWEDSVEGHLAHLDEDWEDYRLEALHAHIMPLYKMSWQQRSEESSGPRQRGTLLMLKWLRDLVMVEKMTMPWTSTNGGQKITVY